MDIHPIDLLQIAKSDSDSLHGPDRISFAGGQRAATRQRSAVAAAGPPGRLYRNLDRLENHLIAAA